MRYTVTTIDASGKSARRYSTFTRAAKRFTEVAGRDPAKALGNIQWMLPDGSGQETPSPEDWVDEGLGIRAISDCGTIAILRAAK